MLKAKIKGFDEVQEMLKEYRKNGALELKKYQSIGTVEECREAMEKQRAKKRILDSYCGFNSYKCPVCGSDVSSENNFCHRCGQRLGDPD